MSEGLPIEVAVPEELLEQLARRVADLIRGDTAGGVRPVAGVGAESPWMTVRQAAAYLGCSRHTIYRHTAAKSIPHRTRRDGHGLLFRRDELDRWIEAEYEAESVRR
jgi:excisionase family DNA binding protein